ncbi:MAG: hypothetical protein Q4C65_02385 [Eubacteriales bacterium]|nr:hypothetical protein [Eubacteriales bacterium]
MAEEDLIFGKNRHFFGGIEPSNMRVFKATSFYDNTTQTARIKLNVVLPEDTVVSGQTLCSVDGAIIRKSTTDYPADEFSGELVADVKANSELMDTDVSIGNTYYYAAFPYSKQGVYNRNSANRSKIAAARYEYFFGYDLDVSDPDPATRVSYPAEVDNASYASAKMDFATNGVFDFGGWPSTPGEKFMPKPCMLAFDGTVSEYLDPGDYTKTVDGADSNVKNKEFEGNAMMEWPKIYTYRTFENGIYKFRCSDLPLSEEYDCWCNYDINDRQIDHFYTAIYNGAEVSGKLRSLSGISPLTSKTTDAEMTFAKANGDWWCTDVLADRLLINDLLVMMGKSTDTQSIYGTGRCKSGNTNPYSSGLCDKYGLFWGNNNQIMPVKVFGMENYWGNIWRRIAGWINDKGTQKIKITEGFHDGSKAFGYNTGGTGYIELENATPSGTASNGYISEMKNDMSWGRIPVVVGGSSTTNEADGMWFNNNQLDYALVGGTWSGGVLAGAFAVTLYNAPSAAGTDCGASISCRPLAV